MATTFSTGVAIDTNRFVEVANGADYLSWASALSLAGRPRQSVALFGGKPFLDMFGGALVAIDQPTGLADQPVQRTWLPVLDPSNACVSLDKLDPRQLSDSLMRAKAKSVAMVSGVGMSLYAGLKGDAAAFLRELGVTTESDLSTVQPFTEKKGGKASYVSWVAAVAAARMTDPDFHWHVNSAQSVDHASGEVSELPVISVPGGYMVSVTVIYRGVEHTEMLPIMGVAKVQTRHGLKNMDHRPLPTPTVFDWNKAVMRCLSKAIAVSTGYGLSVYAKEDVQTLSGGATDTPAPSAPAAANAQQATPARTTTSAPATSGFFGGDFFTPAKPAPAEQTLSEQDKQLVAELTEHLADDAQRARVLNSCVTRRLVDRQPADIADLVKMSRVAAERVLSGLRTGQTQSDVPAPAAAVPTSKPVASSFDFPTRPVASVAPATVPVQPPNAGRFNDLPF